VVWHRQPSPPAGTRTALTPGRRHEVEPSDVTDDWQVVQEPFVAIGDRARFMTGAEFVAEVERRFPGDLP
jgi:hypothetical protein